MISKIISSILAHILMKLRHINRSNMSSKMFYEDFYYQINMYTILS